MVYNLFLAARPQPDEITKFSGPAEKLKSEHQLHGNLIKPENRHVTLVEFTEVREPEPVVLEKVFAAAKRVNMRQFSVTFDRAVSFSGKKGDPLVLTGADCLGLVALQKALIGAMHKEWLKIPANPRYVPHMTLLYADKKIAEVPIPAVRWSVREFVLIRSLPPKSTHIVLGRWALNIGI